MRFDWVWHGKMEFEDETREYHDSTIMQSCFIMHTIYHLSYKSYTATFRRFLNACLEVHPIFIISSYIIIMQRPVQGQSSVGFLRHCQQLLPDMRPA